MNQEGHVEALFQALDKALTFADEIGSILWIPWARLFLKCPLPKGIFRYTNNVSYKERPFFLSCHMSFLTHVGFVMHYLLWSLNKSLCLIHWALVMAEALRILCFFSPPIIIYLFCYYLKVVLTWVLVAKGHFSYLGLDISMLMRDIRVRLNYPIYFFKMTHKRYFTWWHQPNHIWPTLLVTFMGKQGCCWLGAERKVSFII